MARRSRHGRCLTTRIESIGNSWMGKMKSDNLSVASMFGLALCALSACGGAERQTEHAAAGAGANLGGTAPTGGRTATVGGNTAATTGGTQPTNGGQSSSVGAGGRVNATGSVATGGMMASGGGIITGGTSATGGASSSTPPATDCNAVVNGASSIVAVAIAEVPPEPRGGVVANGTYYMTQYRVYTGPNGATNPAMTVNLQYTIVISSSTGDAANVQGVVKTGGSNPSSPIEINATMTCSGTSYSTTPTCSTEASASSTVGSYTATANELLLMSKDTSGATIVSTFTRQ